MKDRIQKLIDLIATTCIPWIGIMDGAIQFIDPIDHVEISAHYGATHAAVALIIYGNEKKNERLRKLGEELLYSVLDRWGKSRVLPGFHNDFNNFALCVLDSYTKEYHNRIQEVVLGTADSNHNTVNWLPMRWFVNECRYEWTGQQKYQDNSRMCAKKIKTATFNDGFIDDRLPVGVSFNLQYDVATVAVMQFLRVQGMEINLEKETGALLNAVCPDGDINYLGRGTNQIFAWGLWVYLLASSMQDELCRAIRYLEDRIPAMLKNNNLMLNDYPGDEKYMWWDYHFCSVYTAHLLLWLVLAWKDAGKAKIEPKLIDDGSSGVHIYKNENAFVATFDGRTEYLAERGPVIAAMWTRKSGVICKGTFGPWMGAFGRKYMCTDVTLRNYFGILKIETEKDWSSSRVIKRLFQNLKHGSKETITPMFAKFDISVDSAIHIYMRSLVDYCNINMTVFTDKVQIKAFGDGEEMHFMNVIRIRNQYGWINIYQSKGIKLSNLEVVIE